MYVEKTLFVLIEAAEHENIFDRFAQSSIV